MLRYSFINENEEPESLYNICMSYIVNNPEKVFKSTQRGYELPEDYLLSRGLSEALLDAFVRREVQLEDKVANIFRNTKKTKLGKVALWDCRISNTGLTNLLKHNLEELTLGYCRSLNYTVLEAINKNGGNLKRLRIDYNVPVIDTSPASIFSKNFELKYYVRKGHVLKLPVLEHLTLKACNIFTETNFYKILLSNLPNLTYLDLSSCVIGGDCLSYIASLTKLTHLILYDVSHVKFLIRYICTIKTLRHLDISQPGERSAVYDDPDATLSTIVESLPELESLDISGTNLPGLIATRVSSETGDGDYKCDISGLVSRVDRPLKFLGLYGTRPQASYRRDIPALVIAGEANEQQLLIACRRYLYRPVMVQKILNDFFHFLRFEENTADVREIVKVIAEALNAHPYERSIQTAATATLFTVLKTKEDVDLPLSSHQKKFLIRTLIKRMVQHEGEETVVRNGLLTLCQFRVPHDFVFMYDRMVSFLLTLINDNKMEGFIHRVSMYLLNSLACQVDDAQKNVLGELRVIENMLVLIKQRIMSEICDDILEIAWSTMWNVTDETPVNSKRFLEGGGMDSFRECLHLFREKSELMRNMMGLLGNVAEVDELRPRLMKYLETFYELLLSIQDGIEVSYNAAGVIAHLASDGEEAWGNDPERVSRKKVLKRMVTCIDKWPLYSERNINYRSFKPILRLARCEHTPECRHWAVWALANLTSVYVTKYCPILEREQGVEIMKEIIDSPKPYPKIKELANVVLRNYEKYKERLAIREQLT